MRLESRCRVAARVEIAAARGANDKIVLAGTGGRVRVVPTQDRGGELGKRGRHPVAHIETAAQRAAIPARIGGKGSEQPLDIIAIGHEERGVMFAGGCGGGGLVSLGLLLGRNATERCDVMGVVGGDGEGPAVGVGANKYVFADLSVSPAEDRRIGRQGTDEIVTKCRIAVEKDHPARQHGIVA